MFSSPQATIFRQWVTWAAAATLLVWMAIVWVHFAGIIIRFYSPLPFYDYWDTVGHIDRYRQLDFGVLWQQHSEHRLVFPEIIFAADYIFFRGREILPLVLSALFYFATWLILSAVLYRSKLPLIGRLCSILLAGIVMGWEGGALLIAAPFLIQWSLMLAAAALVKKHPRATDAQIREAFAGLKCRCGSHMSILRAVKRLTEVA